MLSDKYRVITLDFLGGGQSDRLSEWPADLWYHWGEQAFALCTFMGLRKVNVVGSSGGAVTAKEYLESLESGIMK